MKKYFPIVFLSFCFVVLFGLPIFLHTKYEGLVSQNYPSECRYLINEIKGYIKRPTRFYDGRLITSLVGVSPDAFVYTTEAICHYELKNYELAQRSLDKLFSIDETLLGESVDLEVYKKLKIKIATEIKYQKGTERDRKGTEGLNIDQF